MNRRSFLAAWAGLSAVPVLARAAELLPRRKPRVVVVGSGFGGATAAAYLRRAAPDVEVVLVERAAQYVCCPFSNLVLSGLREIGAQTVSIEAFARTNGITLVRAEARDVDPVRRIVSLTDGTLEYDRLILSPGIDFATDAIGGYDRSSTPTLMPHAWQAGEQTVLLRRKIAAMRDGGTVVISIPRMPYRCPPGAYERACQIAWYLKREKPKSKIVVLDANPDVVAKGELFKRAWQQHYAGMIAYTPGQRAVAIDPQGQAIETEFERVKGDVINLIPPQRAGEIARRAGVVAPESGWCPVDPVSFESTRVPGIHVVGDACNAAPMPKSAFAANSQAKAAAYNLAALLAGRSPSPSVQMNACYSFVTDQEAISVSAVYRVAGGKLETVPRTFATSKAASRAEGRFAESWFNSIRADAFG